MHNDYQLSTMTVEFVVAHKCTCILIFMQPSFLDLVRLYSIVVVCHTMQHFYLMLLETDFTSRFPARTAYAVNGLPKVGVMLN